MNISKVVLYNPQSNASRKPVLPMSLLAIGAMLDGDYDYSILDGNLCDEPFEELCQQIERPGQTVLGVTVMPGPQLQEAVPLCKQLRERFPELTIVWGGYFPSQHWDVCLESGLETSSGTKSAPIVDYVVRSHGEFVFLELLKALEQGLSPEGIAGLACRDSAGVAASSNLAAIPKPAELPEWNLEKVPVERYLRDTFLGRRTIGYNSSYGCPFFCNFCAVVNLAGGKWLAQSAERTASAVETYNTRWGVDAVEMYDNNFFVQQSRIVEFSERIMPLEVAWWGEGRIDTMMGFRDETWRLMRDSGLRMVFLGAESGSQETLDRMDKGGRMSPERTVEMVKRMAEYGIVPELSFVLGNPPDPVGDAHDTMQFIRRIKKINPATEIILYQYTPVPLSGDLFHEAKRSGFKFPDTLDGWISDEWLDFCQRRNQNTMPWINVPGIKLPWLRRSLETQLTDFERVLNAYYPTSTMRSMRGLTRTVLRGVSAWRYHSHFYSWPIELAVLQKAVHYRRPETAGF